MTKQEKEVEEAKPDQGDRRGEFVSCWRPIDQRKKELASFLLARECLSLPMAPLSSPVVAVGPSLKSFPPLLGVVHHLNSTARLAGLCSNVPLEEEEK